MMKYLTVDQVAERWNVSRETVIRAMRVGGLVCTNFRTRCYRFLLEDVEDYEQRQRQDHTRKIIRSEKRLMTMPRIQFVKES
jgi:excisionase family DNA binding protein